LVFRPLKSPLTIRKTSIVNWQSKMSKLVSGKIQRRQSLKAQSTVETIAVNRSRNLPFHNLTIHVERDCRCQSISGNLNLTELRAAHLRIKHGSRTGRCLIYYHRSGNALTHWCLDFQSPLSEGF